MIVSAMRLLSDLNAAREKVDETSDEEERALRHLRDEDA
jgi:hypothetical protein